MSVSEPAYRDGWNVRANPDGKILNYGDGKIYPYLFWEGYGLNYSIPEEGFVVKKEDVKNFLSKKLLQLGLIKSEADEFMAYWVPRMQKENYIFITFVPPACL